MFNNLPWEQREKIYITVLIISMTVNILSIVCLSYAYKALTAAISLMEI